MKMEKFKCFKNRTVILLLVLLTLFSVLTFVNLGSFSTPKNYYTMNPQMDYSGKYNDDYAVFELEVKQGKTELGEIWINFGAVSSPSQTAKMSLKYQSYYAENDESWYSSKLGDFTVTNNTDVSNEYKNIYKWEKIFSVKDFSTSYNFIKLKTDSKIVVNEIVFLEKDTRKPIPFKTTHTLAGKVESNIDSKDEHKKEKEKIYKNAQKFSDEQDKFFETNTVLNSLTDAEISNAVTAFSFLKGDGNYLGKVTPPLGSIITAVGISIFGTSIFGFRIMTALFSILCVFLVYLLGKKIFKSRGLSLALAFIFAISGLSFGLGRLALTEMFMTVFVILAFIYSIDFYQNGINKNDALRSGISMFLSGVFCALAVSVSWTGVFAIVGVVMIHCFEIIKEYDKYSLAVSKANGNTEKISKYKKLYNYKLKYTLVSALLGFIVVGFFLYIGFYALTYASYSEAFNELNFFKMFGLSQKALFGLNSSAFLQGVKSSNCFGWLIGLAPASIFTNVTGKYTASLLIMANQFIFYLSAISVVFILVYLIVCLIKNKRSTLSDESYKLYVDSCKSFELLIIGFLVNFMFYLTLKNNYSLINFLTASIFYFGFIVMSINIILTKFKKPMFAFKNGTVVTAGIFTVSLLALIAIVIFGLSYVIYTGVSVDTSFLKFLTCVSKR